MISKSQLLTIVAIVFTASPAMAMEKIGNEFSKDSTTEKLQKIYLNENRNNSNDLQSQSPIPSEKTMIPSEEDVAEKIPVYRRRKSSESPRIKIYTAPRSISPKKAEDSKENQKKADECQTMKSISISPEEPKESIEHLTITPFERKTKPAQPGHRRYFLDGPIAFYQASFSNSSEGQQKASSEDEGVISPRTESKDPI